MKPIAKIKEGRPVFYYEVWQSGIFDSQFSTGYLAYKRLKEIQAEKTANGQVTNFVKIKKYSI